MSWTDTPCKLWTGAKTKDGYGNKRIGTKTYRVHRLAWIEARGPIPPETPHVLHRCDNRVCYEVEHLFLGTNADNVADRVAKGRNGLNDNVTKTHCPQGHPYNEENTRLEPWGSSGKVRRKCRVCDRDRHRERYQAQQEQARGADADRAGMYAPEGDNWRR